MDGTALRPLTFGESLSKRFFLGVSPDGGVPQPLTSGAVPSHRPSGIGARSPQGGSAHEVRGCLAGEHGYARVMMRGGAQEVRLGTPCLLNLISGVVLVGAGGLEPPKLTQRIYSPPPLPLGTHTQFRADPFGQSAIPCPFRGGWYHRLGSNQRPLDPQSSALTN